MRYLIAVITLSSCPVLADGMDGMIKAGELGGLLASEKMCGLSYDQAAIERWIDQNVDPSDMGFAGNLNMQTRGSASLFERQSESQRTAHCASVIRTAKHFGFIK